MNLTDSSIEELVKGNITHLPVNLQILDIRQLNVNIDGTFVARLKLSDGKYYYGGFVIDISMLSILNVNVYAIINIKQLLVLRHSQEKFVLQILQMDLIAQCDECLGYPRPWCTGIDDTTTYVTQNSIQHAEDEYPIFLQANNVDVNTPIAISELSTSVSTRVIEGVITRKSEICMFGNGIGRFFTFDIADLHSEIRCKVFNNIVDMFYNLITTRQAYRIENFVLTRSNKQYNHLSHSFEINLTKNTIVRQIPNHDFSNIHVLFNFVNVSDISFTDMGKCIDFCGLIKSVNTAEFIYVAKKNSHSHRRIITVADDTGEIDIVLWSHFAKNFSAAVNQKVGFKDLLIQHFKEKLQLSSTMMSVIHIYND